MIICLFLFLIFLPQCLWAAVTHDTHTTANFLGAIQAEAPLTIGGGCANPLLVPKLGWVGGQSITGANTTAGGLTPGGAGGVQYGFPSWQAAIYYRAGTTGMQTVTIDFSGAADNIELVLESYCGVNQGSPVGTVVTPEAGFSSGDPTADITTEAGGMGVDIVVVYPETTITANLGQTETDNFAPTGLLMGASYKSGTGTLTMGWTTGTGVESWGMVAMPIKPVVTTVIRHKPIVIQ